MCTYKLVKPRRKNGDNPMEQLEGNVMVGELT